MEYIVDTHALFWYLSADPKLGQKAKEVFKRSEKGKCDLVVPIVVLLEALVIIEKLKVNFTWKEFIEAISVFPKVVVYPINSQILPVIREVSSKLELHDRSIVATAKVFSAPVITLDPEIKKYGKVGIIW
jgi:PIN domain nuclease of toxin-antitoxin system